ncbi:MAG: hypothetical protein VZR73_07335 [Acutalibacteraceae bacterium]|nr:hypothetical protein [Clostridia bacterium]MEE3403880.1 hypothetical protein [Acutalibacteraceae bacterium]
MDEKAAWNHFVMTGRVSDYLNYCRIKLGYPAADEDEKAEEHDENGNGRPDSDEPGRWR